MQQKESLFYNKIFYNKVKDEFVHFKKHLPLTILALPGVIYFIILKYIPIYGLVLPFKNYNASLGFLKSPWTGFKNFEYLFTGNEVWQATKNTICYNLAFIIVGMTVSILIALLLFEMNKGFVKIYQTALLLPFFISWVVVAFVFKTFLDMDYGIFNKILSLFGKDGILWYSESRYWPPLLVIAAVWKNMGYNAIIYYTALMGIDKELFEAAKIDGAGKFKLTWYISIPMLKTIITILFILSIGKILNADFGLFYNIPLNSSLLYETTDVLDTYVYRAMIVLGDTGMAAAAGFFQAVIGFILVFLTNTAVKKIDSEQGLF